MRCPEDVERKEEKVKEDIEIKKKNKVKRRRRRRWWW